MPDCSEARSVARGALRGGLRHLEVVEDGNQFQQQRGVRILGGLDAFARGAFFEIFQIARRCGGGVPNVQSALAARVWRSANCSGVSLGAAAGLSGVSVSSCSI